MSEIKLWRDLPMAVVDVETTGLDPAEDRVIEIAVVHMQGGEVLDTYNELVNPERELPPEAANITGIKPEDLVDAPRFADLVDELLERLDGRGFVAYNLGFDRAFVKAEFERCGVDWDPSPCIDPLVFVRELHKNQGSKRLGAVCERLGITLDNAHRADADAIAAGRVLYALAEQLPEELEDLLLLQTQWAQAQENEMAGWKSRRGGGAIDEGVASLGPTERGNALGPAYVYGDDTDPVRAMFAHLPDSGSRR
ncbi:MAG: 3'-5' exonuclease [Myxococcota bacterium]